MDCLDFALIGPLGKVNLLAGQNNAGKSNVLRFAAKFLSGNEAPTGLDVPQGQGAVGRIEFAIADRISDDQIKQHPEPDLRTIPATGTAQRRGGGGLP